MAQVEFTQLPNFLSIPKNLLQEQTYDYYYCLCDNLYVQEKVGKEVGGG